MSAEKATAFVLRVIEFSESSSVVTLFTREFGKISGLAEEPESRRVRLSLHLTYLPSVA